jgi:hypothetical protein
LGPTIEKKYDYNKNSRNKKIVMKIKKGFEEGHRHKDGKDGRNRLVVVGGAMYFGNV